MIVPEGAERDPSKMTYVEKQAYALEQKAKADVKEFYESMPERERPDNDAVQAALRVMEAKKCLKDSKKQDETHVTSVRMKELWEQRGRNSIRGVSASTLDNSAETISEIEKYIRFVCAIDLLPSMEGLAIWFGTDNKKLREYRNAGTETSKVLDTFVTYLMEYHLQFGLASSTNPAFPIYYSKAVLGLSDNTQNPGVTINIGTSTIQKYMSAEKSKEVIELTPTEWEEVKE